MKFKLEINLTDQDYLDYNIFWQLKSPYGSKRFKGLRILLLIILSILVIINFMESGFSVNGFLGILPLLIAAALLWFLFPKITVGSIKSQIKALKKQGKLPYTPSSVMEFYEDKIVDISPLMRVEEAYAMIERVSIVENQVIYIHTSNVGGHIIPRSCFTSPEEFVSFIEFLKTKNGNIQCY